MRPLTLLLLIFLAGHSFAQTERIGLVLSGGGARGLAHIGVIRALEEQNIKVHAIAGTSMGAIVGALYASGKTVDELEEIARTMDWSQAFSDLPPRDRLSFRRKQDTRGNVATAGLTLNGGIVSLPKGVVQGQNLQLMLQQQFVHVSDINDFDRLGIPFRAVASDLVTGEAVVFRRGSLATAVRASMSIPGLFAPVEIDGKMLVDGGIANNLPVDVVKAMGVDHVIAVDIATPLYTAAELDSVIPIIEQLTTLLTFNRLKTQYALLDDDDLLITPDLSDVSTAAFEKTDLAIERGYDAIQSFSHELARYAQPGPLDRGSVPAYAAPKIDRIEIRNDSDISDKLIEALVRQAVGTPLDDAQLREDIESIYGYEYFESVQYQIVAEEAGNTLLITAQDRTWGKDSLGAGLELYSDTRANSGYNLRVKYQKTGITRKGGEWDNELQFGQDPIVGTELYLPLDYRQALFARPYARYSERTYNRVAVDNIEGRERLDEFIFGLFVGAEFSNKGTLGLGIESHTGDIKQFVGAGIPEIRFDDAITYLRADYDDMDNVAFPREGALATAEYRWVNAENAPDFSQISLQVSQAIPITRHSLVFGVDYLASTIDRVPRHLQGRLGGFGRISGLRHDALIGNNLLFLNLTYLHRLDQQSMLPVDLPLYLGVSVEAGNAWATQDEITPSDLLFSGLLMLGMDTPLGPLYFGYGKTETDSEAFYVRLGYKRQQ
ncbi:MAG: patatin-like phospholipase family protein [Pseudomonadota bacterium]